MASPDLSNIPDSDLVAMSAGDWSKVSDDTLSRLAAGNAPDMSAGARGRTILNSAAGGALAIPGIPMTVANQVLNLGKAAIGYPYSKLTGNAVPDALAPTPDEDVPGSVGYINQTANMAGVNTGPVDPRDALQRYTGAAAAALPSMALGQPETAPEAAMQAVGAITGGMGQQAAADAGVGPAGQALAGTLAGGAPGLMAGIPTATLRAIFGRGGNVDYDTLRALYTAKQAGISNPTLGQASGRSWPQALEAYFSRMPGSAGQFRDQMAAQASQAASTIKGIVDNLADRNTARAAGLAIEGGVEGSFMDRTAATRQTLYNTLDNHIPPTTQTDISPYSGALDKILAPVKGAEAQSAVIQSETNGDFLTTLRASLQHDLKMGGLPEGSKPFTQPAQDYYTDGTHVVQAADAAKAGIDRIPSFKHVQTDAVPGYIVPGDTGPKFVAEKDVTPATTLPYGAVAKLRTMIGDKMDADSLQGNRTDGNLKAIYGALSDSMRGAAEAQGPQALNAFNRANTYYTAYRDRVDTLNSILNKKGGPEAVYQYAMSGSKQGASQLHSIMQSLPQDAKNTVIATTLNRMGMATPGAQNAAGDAWSFNTFLTNYNRMSPAARAEVFGRIQGDYGQQLDSLVKFSSQYRDAGKPYQNSSGTAAANELLSTKGAVLTAGAAAATGHFLPAGALLVGLGANQAGVRLVTNPRFVSWLANSYRMPQSATPALIAQLANTAKKENDPALAQVASIFQQRLARLTAGKAPADLPAPVEQ